MASISVCARRPLLFKTTTDRRSKPPDVHSMVYGRVRDDLQKAKLSLLLEKCRSEEQSEDIEDLRVEIRRLRREKQEAVEECISVRQEAQHLLRSKDRLESQLQEARERNQQARSHSFDLQSRNCLLHQNQAEDIRGVQTLFKTSTSSSARINGELRNKLRVAAVLLGVTQCVHSESNSSVRDVQSLQQDLEHMSIKVKDLRKENERLKTKQQLDLRWRKDNEGKVKLLETELKKTKYEKKEQEVVNEGIKSVISQHREEQKDWKHKINSLIKNMLLKYDQAGRVRELVQELQRSTGLIRENLDTSNGQLQELSRSSGALKMKMKQDQKVERKLGEILTGMRELREAYHKAIAMIKDRTTTSSKGGALGVRQKLQESTAKRKSIFNRIQDIRGNIRVFCRVRPQKKQSNAPPIITIPHSATGNNWKMICRDECFSFDRIFGQSARNRDVYGETAGVVETVLDGSNVCILAYGQTGSGKSYTMEGVREDPGVNFLALQHLFHLISKRKDASTVLVNVSVVELYNDEIQDLLFESGLPREARVIGSSRRKNGSGNNPEKRRGSQKLQIHKVSPDSEEVHVPGVTKSRVTSVTDVKKVMEKAKRRRSVSATRMNAESSRSHLIVEVEVQRQDGVAKLHLVDLAGSERVQRSQVTGARLKEAVHINKSLSTLGNVFSALEHQRAHVPYRDTKLTHLLSNSIGGKAKTLMFITVSGDTEDTAETRATLEFGKRVGSIVLHENESVEKMDQLRKLEEELRKVELEIDEEQKNTQ